MWNMLRLDQSLRSFGQVVSELGFRVSGLGLGVWGVWGFGFGAFRLCGMDKQRCVQFVAKV